MVTVRNAAGSIQATVPFLGSTIFSRSFQAGESRITARVWEQRAPAGEYIATGGFPSDPEGRFAAAASGPVRFSIVEAGNIERVPLTAGCTNLTLTWPDGTSLSAVAEAINPRDALEAVWKLDPTTGRFLGYSPRAGAPNDLTAAGRLDAVFVCLERAGTLMRPLL